MLFSELATEFMNELQQSGNRGQGIGQAIKKTTIITVILKSEQGVEEINGVPLHFESEDATADSTEAQLVRSGIWRSSDVGWLWLSLLGKKIVLAKVSPEGKKDLSRGWVSNKRQIIIQRSEEES